MFSISIEEFIICGLINITTLSFAEFFTSFANAAPIYGKPPRHGMPCLLRDFVSLTIPLKTKKCLFGMWTDVFIIVFDVVMPTTWPKLSVVVPGDSLWELSKSIVSVILSEFPRIGVIVKLTPISLYSKFVVTRELPAWELFVITDPEYGILFPLNIFEVFPSWAIIFGVITTDVSASVCRACKRDARDKKDLPLWNNRSPIIPKSKPLERGMLAPVGVFVFDIAFTVFWNGLVPSWKFPIPPAALFFHCILEPQSRPNDNAFTRVVSIIKTSINTCFNGTSKLPINSFIFARVWGSPDKRSEFVSCTHWIESIVFTSESFDAWLLSWIFNSFDICWSASWISFPLWYCSL